MIGVAPGSPSGPASPGRAPAKSRPSPRCRLLAALDHVREKERATVARIAAGATIPAWVDELIESERTRRLD